MPQLNRRALLGAGAMMLAAPAVAQTWPDRPIRLVVAFPAGSVTDTLMRHLAEPLGRELGQPVIVDNRPGGSGVVGTESAARSPADGHTWVVLSVTNGALNTYTIRRLPYDPIRDFAPIGFVAETAYILVVPASSPARDLRGFIEHARASRTPLTFSHGNSSALIASATLARLAGVDMMPIPYRGGPEALTDVIAGRIDSTFTDFAAGMPQVREGKVRALAVTLPQRFSLAPEIPTVASVLPEFTFDVWFGMGVPAGTPAPVVARANAALNKVLADPELKERLARLGYAPRGSTPQEFQDFLRNQITVLSARAREAGLEQQ
ncbi:tripartite tricarboxylate transporter substrate binding protein [Roseomonas eburnea]|uniref:Tripartite tricarboxylate transporter substrate binding protein n=1 Tax=Neoroseomonas eburnea TaxID=1346889 RepID=A0A9X9X6C6_9PROT|nr:tripartite tricarboxylate transporter substrate binding protein [Neoroseomonas eburnea]MBR0679262.1 tripartite tricarboxylate transporter substrate binding protein [Neoroseomonas eburnea]